MGFSLLFILLGRVMSVLTIVTHTRCLHPPSDRGGWCVQCSVLSQASVSFPPYSAAEASAADDSLAGRVLAVTEEDSGLLIPVIIVTIVFRILDPKSSWSGVTLVRV